MTSSPPRVALLGCGRIARLFHLDALARSEAVALVAVADADAEARAAAARRVPGVAAFADYREAIAHPDVDAVVVCLPTGLHAPAAIAAFEAGRHVYLEKPVATDLDEASAVVAAWRRSGRVGMVGFNFRFHPVFRSTRAAIVAGRVGDLVGVRTVNCSAPRSLPEWKRLRGTGGGALLDLASHHADLVAHLVGQPVTAVSASVRSVRSEDDTAVVTLRLAEGLPVQTFVSLSAAQTDRVEILGTAGTLVADRYRRAAVDVVPVLPAASRAERLRAGAGAVGDALRDVRATLLPRPERSFAAALDAFAAAVGGGPRTGADLDAGYRSLAVVAAAERAAASGRTEPVPEPSPDDAATLAPAPSEPDMMDEADR